MQSRAVHRGTPPPAPDARLRARRPGSRPRRSRPGRSSSSAKPRLDDSRDRRARAVPLQPRARLRGAPDRGPRGSPRRLRAARGTSRPCCSSTAPRYSSSLSLGEEQIPADLRSLVEDGELAYERTDVADTRYLVTGGEVPRGDGSDRGLLLLLRGGALRTTSPSCGTILLIGLGIVVVVAALAGALARPADARARRRAPAAPHARSPKVSSTRGSRSRARTSSASGPRPSTRWPTRSRARSRASRRRRRASAASPPTSRTSCARR